MTFGMRGYCRPFCDETSRPRCPDTSQAMVSEGVLNFFLGRVSAATSRALTRRIDEIRDRYEQGRWSRSRLGLCPESRGNNPVARCIPAGVAAPSRAGRFRLRSEDCAGGIIRPMTRKKTSKSAPPEGLPVYRVLSGPDDDAFCRRVSEAIALGYLVHGSPAVTFDGEDVIVAQAVIWPSARESVASRS